jgi:predicted RNA-binding Zn ribbon-like protein
MKPLFLGGHPAVDFLNTSLTPDGERIETIPDGHAFLQWLVDAGLLDAAEAPRLTRRFGVKALDATAAEVRKVREWAREWLARWRARPKADYAEEIASLNKLIARAGRARELEATGQGLAFVERLELDSPGALVALVATQLATLLAEEDPALIRDCAGTGCTLTFVDRTKAHRRQFCSASVCGNRAKVAAFRSRQKG